MPKWKPGCPEPYIEDMKYNVIDKFFRNGKFGYVFELTTPVKFSKAGFQTVNPRIFVETSHWIVATDKQTFASQKNGSDGFKWIF